MVADTARLRTPGGLTFRDAAPFVGAAVAFGLLFAAPAVTLVRDWLTDPDASHGLLLAPIAVWIAWRRGLVPDRRPSPVWGLALLGTAVAFRYLSGLAAELFTMRASMMLALAGLVIFVAGWRQLRRWWLPAGLLALSVPMPVLVSQTMAFPLQLTASKWGAALLEWRHVPVELSGNVLLLPGQALFVTEACSGLRSLTALLALGLLVGGLWLRTPLGRAVLLLASIPVAMVLNGIRVFLTGFLVYYVDPALARGFMHYTEGWVIFVVAFLILGGLTRLIVLVEDRRPPHPPTPAEALA